MKAEDREWQIEQPPVEEMLSPVQCMHCRAIYCLGYVQVTGRFTDCSVWTSPCCGVRGIDNRPWVRGRHYQELTSREAQALAASRGYEDFLWNPFPGR